MPVTTQQQLAAPVVVRAAERPLIPSCEVNAGVSLRRLFTQRDHQSLMTAGIYELAAGEASRWWSTEVKPWEERDVFNVGQVHEFLYVLQGTCTVETPGVSVDCNENTAIFIPPEGRFRMVNRSNEVTKVIYCLTPALL